MRINEILTESQLQQLEEGPMLNAFGRGVGKFAGGLAKGIGAVAGGVVGAGKALKKGYQTGKAIVGDDPDPNAGAPGYTAPADQTAPAPVADPKANTTPAPAPTPTPSTTTPPSADEINAQGPEGSAPAKTQTGDAGKALAKSTAVVDKTQAQSQEKANQTVYAQVKANVDKLDKKGKQRILQLLTKSLSAPAPKPAAPKAPAGGAPTAADPAAAPAAAPTAADPAAAPAAGAAPEPANTMANAPVSATNTAAADNPNQPPPATTGRTQGGGKQKGVQSQTPKAIAGRAATQARKDAAAKAKAAGAGAFGQMSNTLQQQNASKNNYGNALSEALAQRVEMHKQKMFETGLARGTVSVFRK
jgi:hypothetical protein